ncbi:MAG: hypothetical protein ACKON8_05305, partial [Planctomycetota bacterium]
MKSTIIIPWLFLAAFIHGPASAEDAPRRPAPASAAPAPAERGALALPDVFPINMGFKTLQSKPGAPNHGYDTVEIAGRYAVHHGNAAKMDEIKRAFPKVMTIAMNVRGPERAADVRRAETADVWPGFFLYRAGSRLTSAVDTSKTQIMVEDASRFSTRDYALLSPLNADGRPSFFDS